MKRFFAYATDMALVSCILYLIFIVVLFAGGISFSLLKTIIPAGGDKGFAVGAIAIGVLILVGILCFYHGYFIYFESQKGFTPGKKLFGLKVTSTRGGRLTVGQCVLRDMMRYIDCVLILPGMLSIILTQKCQRLGDMMAGTLVIHSSHQEEAGNFLYMKQDDFLVLKESWTPSTVPLDVCKTYLEFAYPVFCQGKEPKVYGEVEKWQDISLNFVHPKTADPIEQQTLLLFFAELCFQTYQKRSHS